MQELIPYVACVCTEDEFEQAKQSYSEVYVLTSVGKIYKHLRLTKGRHIRHEISSIKDIPNYKAESVISEDINFLPAGKIPPRLFADIVAFFKEVMVVKNGVLEAMAHILWNENDGYHIAIPNQKISQASVTYDFQSHIKPGDMIVVDIH